MGLAASQARFLGITARKSNIEYEGQQVNQQRTALAEEVNALFGRLTALQVPIAPSAEDFYTTNYTFEVEQSDGLNGSYKISNYYDKDGAGLYHVEYSRTYHDTAATATWVNHSSVYKDSDDNYKYKPSGSTEDYPLEELTDETDLTNYKQYLKDAGAYKYYNKETGLTEELSDDEIAADKIYKYKNEETGKMVYFSEYQITTPTVDLNYYSIGDTTLTESGSWDDVSLTMDSNGRIKNIQLAGKFGSTSVNAAKTYDTEGYEEALKDYTMSRDEYNKAVEDINAKTKSLQQEDKVLELRLNQIDTEQNELSTELEAVKAVLDKNIENTFKTFA